MDNTRISEKVFSVPIGFGGYLLTIDIYSYVFKFKNVYNALKLIKLVVTVYFAGIKIAYRGHACKCKRFMIIEPQL